ncbi:tetratricopeptide repeat protein [Phocaeicola sartorii]|uniref:tetratricopeptide repeat protein n=1 Tax=Phocaeicola sartorii TaxID=671267 RepID=UPI002558364E|nr:hypothetical protein [Phocaeicola sartorii]
MKNIIVLIIIFLLIGCSKRQPINHKLLHKAEKMVNINADSALAILTKISSPDELSTKDLAHWCMLSGKVTDKIYTSLPPTYLFEHAYKWYSSHGTIEDQVQMQLYLGRAYAEDGDYDSAMSTYTEALEIASDNHLDNAAGYISSYMGTLYEEKGMREQAIKKFKIAAIYFKTANNNKSYACALRDIGREYARTDSLTQALAILHTADSIAINVNHKNAQASIINTIGGIYRLQQEYEKAKSYYYKAIALGTNKIPNYMGLINIYIETYSLDKAKELLKNIPENNPKYIYGIKRFHSFIYRKEKQYEKALDNLEEYVFLIDSIVNAKNQSRILNIEEKYNDLKKREKINELTINQQKYIIILSICIAGILSIVIANMLYRKQVKDKIQKQQDELSEVRNQLLHLSLDLEKKKIKLSSLKEKNESYNQMKNEITHIISNYKNLQNKMIADSALYKELVHLANQHIPRINKTLITEKQWGQIIKEITGIYPNLHSYILDLCDTLSEQEWQYCCFCMFGFDTNAEAKLLNINLASVRTKRHRLRQKLGIIIPTRISFQEYIAEQLI